MSNRLACSFWYSLALYLLWNIDSICLKASCIFPGARTRFRYFGGLLTFSTSLLRVTVAGISSESIAINGMPPRFIQRMQKQSEIHRVVFGEPQFDPPLTNPSQAYATGRLITSQLAAAEQASTFLSS